MAGGQLTIRFMGDVRDFDRATQGLGSKLQGIGKTLSTTLTPAAAGAAIAFTRMGDQWDAAVHASASSAGDFEEIMGSVRATAGRVTQGMGDVSVALNSLADRTGLAGKPLEELTKKFLDLERLTGEASATLIPNITRLFGDWSIATDQQSESMDQLWRLSERSGISLGGLSDLMVQFGSPLRQLGLDFETTAAMFARFEQEGVNIQTVLPGMRMALKNFALAGREPAPALLETIEAIKNTASVAEANTIAFEIFGVRAGADLAAAIREGRFELDDYLAAMRDTTSTIDGAIEAGTTLGDKLKMLGNRVTAMLGPFGTLGSLIAGAVASIGPLIFGLGALAKAFDGATLSATRFGTAVKALPALAFNPLTLALAASTIGVVALTDKLQKYSPVQADGAEGAAEYARRLEEVSGWAGRAGPHIAAMGVASRETTLDVADLATAQREGTGVTEEITAAIDTATASLSGFFETDEEAAEWRESFNADLRDVQGVLGELADKANVTANEVIQAFVRQQRELDEYEQNWLALNARNLPDELRQQLADMGIEGANIVAALAGANERKFNQIIQKWEDAQNEADAVTSAVEGIGRALSALPTRIDIAINATGNLVGGLQQFHHGGVFRAPVPGGEGLAILRDRERVIPGGGMGGGHDHDRPAVARVLNVTINGDVSGEELIDKVLDALARDTAYWETR